MEVIYKKRQQGKTTRLLNLASEKKLVIIVKDNARRRHLIDKAMRLGIYILDPMTWESFYYNVRGLSKPCEGYCIDDLDDIIQEIFSKTNLNLVAVSLTDCRPNSIDFILEDN